MSININLATQEGDKHKKVWLFIGVLLLVWLGINVIFPSITLGKWSWLPLLPTCIEAILYGLGKRGIFINNFPYLRIDENRIESFAGGFFSKPKSVQWVDLTHLDVKLFELTVMTSNQMKVNFDLTGLTDDNLKLVKDLIGSLKKQKGL